MERNILISTAYYPPLSYISELQKAKNIIIEAHENYNRQTYRNRCEILSCNGKLTLSIPIKKTKGKKQTIKEVEIDNSTNWQKLHFNAIRSSYGKSPFYPFYSDQLLEPLYLSKTKYLFDLNNNILERILNILKISNSKINYTESYHSELNNTLDLRESFHPKKESLQNTTKPYIQTFSDRFDFISNLSILDLLFNTGPEQDEYL